MRRRTRRGGATLLTLGALALGACGPQVSLELLGDHPELEGVQLGMTATAFQRVRAPTDSGPNGFQDVRPDSALTFEFIFHPGGSMYDSVPPASSILVAVRRYEAGGTLTGWEGEVRAMAVTLGKPDACLRTQYVLSDGAYAEWHTDPPFEVSFLVQDRMTGAVVPVIDETRMSWSVGRISRPLDESYATFRMECPSR